MDLRKAISERRSHRQFTDKKISQKEIKEVLEAGLFAPSPKNRHRRARSLLIGVP